MGARPPRRQTAQMEESFYFPYSPMYHPTYERYLRRVTEPVDGWRQRKAMKEDMEKSFYASYSPIYHPMHERFLKRVTEPTDERRQQHVDEDEIDDTEDFGSDGVQSFNSSGATLPRNSDSCTVDSLRTHYIQRVMSTKTRHVIVFDWDDTLICTSYLALVRNDPSKCSPDSLARFEEIMVKVTQSRVVSQAKSYCQAFDQHNKTYIVTLAPEKWISTNTSETLKSLLEGVVIIKCQDAAVRKDKCQWQQWLEEEFENIGAALLPFPMHTNFLVISCHNFYLDAALRLKESFPNSYLKTVALRSLSNPLEMAKQWESLEFQLSEILSHPSDCDFQLDYESQ